ncbi:MAG: hypothetical protein ACREIB_09680, partial [Pseudomonadota bacterium]
GPTSSPERYTLNPRFVEWLMGWPDNWSAVSIDSAPAGTELSRWLQRMRGALSMLISAQHRAAERQAQIVMELV